MFGLSLKQISRIATRKMSQFRATWAVYWIKNQYNGYRFASSEGEALYNSTSLIYFLRELTIYRQPPKFLTDLNLRTELTWVRRAQRGPAGSNPMNTAAFIETVTTENRIPFARTFLRTKFNSFGQSGLSGFSRYVVIYNDGRGAAGRARWSDTRALLAAPLGRISYWTDQSSP